MHTFYHLRLPYHHTACAWRLPSSVSSGPAKKRKVSSIIKFESCGSMAEKIATTGCTMMYALECNGSLGCTRYQLSLHPLFHIPRGLSVPNQANLRRAVRHRSPSLGCSLQDQLMTLTLRVKANQRYCNRGSPDIYRPALSARFGAPLYCSHQVSCANDSSLIT